MYEVDHNISSYKLGETGCYHIGNLAVDRNKKVATGYKTLMSGEKINTYGDLTNSAATLDILASDIYKRSTGSWSWRKDSKSCIEHGTWEFFLFQQRLTEDNDNYIEGLIQFAYLARRISKTPRQRKSYC